MNDKLVDIKNATTLFGTKKAIDEIDLSIFQGETLGLVGESGSGKTTLGRGIIRLTPISSGSICYRGEEISSLKERAFSPYRKAIQMIFQDPYASLNPRMTIEDIVAEPLDIHGFARGTARTPRVAELLELVGLNPGFAPRFPHELSGGQRQRVGIARALAVDPEFIICDEAISALDVSVQAQIINLLKRLQKELGLTYLFIAHDLNMVKYISDRIAVMHHGHLVEVGTSDEIFNSPGHPYTRHLLSAIPEIGIKKKNIRSEKIPKYISAPKLIKHSKTHFIAN